MKKIVIIFCICLVACFAGYAQTVTLKFTGRDSNGRYCQLDSVLVVNTTKGWQVILYWPDTVLTMQNGVGIEDAEMNSSQAFQLSQNNPNPFSGTTDVNLTVADAGPITLELADGNGRIVGASQGTRHGTSLQCGTHQFRISVATAGIYVLTARQNDKTSSIKMVCNGGGNGNAIEYAGVVGTRHGTSQQCATPKSHPRGITTNPFRYGDMMEYVGYATINGDGVESQHITHAQGTSQTFLLQFAVAQDGGSGQEDDLQDGQPCQGTPVVVDVDGNAYNTVQIGSQCWMRENLKTTRYANGISPIEQGVGTSSTVAYWYYPNNDSANKSIYGLLYNWKAVMRNSSSSNYVPSYVQGICPDGWHVPSHAEWDVLMEYMTTRNIYWCNLTPAQNAKALASTERWSSYNVDCTIGCNPNANNATGFTALPAGEYYWGDYMYITQYALFWSATVNSGAFVYTRSLYSHSSGVATGNFANSNACSVRCLRD